MYYRYADDRGYDDGSGDLIRLWEYVVISETEKTVVLVARDYVRADGTTLDWADRHRVLKNPHGKRFAYSMRPLALASYRARKERQVRILSHQLDRAKDCLAACADMVPF